MTAHIKIKASEAALLRTHYRGLPQNALRLLWGHKYLISAFVLAGLQLGLVAVVLLPPKYTSEAILQVSFSREEPSTGPRMQRIASAEAVSVVESATRIIRSRTLASAVVARLGLESDSAFASPSPLRRALWHARESLGAARLVPSAKDIATERLMGSLRVNIEPRSYVISIATTTEHPERAAQFANAVALEYLRGERLHQITEAQRNLERELGEISSVYGALHPRRLAAQAKLEMLQASAAELARGNDARGLNGGELIPARPVMLPSGPSTAVVVATALAAALLICAGMILYLERSTSK